ncbi:DUF4102 domain-containing protein [Tolypothrix sp. FACHB-123]|uniref:DUF4102 domain-containing protein n=1 Tax=Tolypothrix sp. FACHB-123 TaxID=2692868 RepID=UPI001682F52C|nr:DUF4102 domain-containing protein [Tolypothrix sp. FACHB-123]MBD2354756.1 DUF4102 domain-containing protein [Tolypothrix sp. FACHB-123]
MNEQLSLFTIHPVQVAKPKSDPYWDEITRQPQTEGDSVSSSVGKYGELELPPKGLGNSVVPNLFTTENVRPQVTQPTPKQFADEQTHWVQEYWVKRNGEKYYYYRYCWMVGRKKNCIHIGSVTNPIAKAKKEDVEIAIADGESPEYIRQLLKPQS